MSDAANRCPSCVEPLTQVGDFWICPKHGQVSLGGQAAHDGAWVFVSHSRRDLERVRGIRNYLESKGRNPLLFFLKCLDNDDARLPGLIRDEIIARDWFILCDSENSRASKYVAQEIELVGALEGKVFETIDLDNDLGPQLHKLDRLSKRATIFLSYARQDKEVAGRIQEALIRHDFQVWRDPEIKPGEDWAHVIQSAIDDAVTRGFVLVLLSPASLTSESCRQETEYALQLAGRSHKSRVVPVLVAPFAPELLPRDQFKFEWFDLTNGSFDERVEGLIRNLKAREME